MDALRGRSRPSQGDSAFAAQAGGLCKNNEAAWRRAWDGSRSRGLFHIKPLEATIRVVQLATARARGDR
jgi:hypothetical protein